MTGPLIPDHSAFLLVFQPVVADLLTSLCSHLLSERLSVFKEPYSKVKGHNATPLT